MYYFNRRADAEYFLLVRGLLNLVQIDRVGLQYLVVLHGRK